MKAIVQTRYGSPDVLQLKDIDKPAADDDEVLIRVHAAAVNIGDWHIIRNVAVGSCRAGGSTMSRRYSEADLRPGRTLPRCMERSSARWRRVVASGSGLSSLR